MRFEFESSENIGVEDKESGTRNLVEHWINKLKDKLQARFEVKDNSQAHVSGLIRVPSLGHLKISYSWKHLGNRGGSYFSYANLNIETENLTVLEEVLKVGDQPYWYIRYKYNIDLDVTVISNRVKNLTGISPSGPGYVKYGDGPYILTHIEYPLLENVLRVFIDRGNSYDGTITLTYNIDSYNKGFWKAHKLLSPDLLLSSLYGELTLAEIKQLLDKAIEPIYHLIS